MEGNLPQLVQGRRNLLHRCGPKEQAFAKGDTASYWSSQSTRSWFALPSVGQILYQNAIAPFVISHPAFCSDEAVTSL